MTVAEALARIEADDAALKAWVWLDRQASVPPGAAGPLAGVPFGVKDIIDVFGMPTRYGLFEHAEPARLDAWCVAALRAAGAVPVGKTQTTPFAFRDAAPTRNPHHRERTPGGSSSGSAAAVAAGHVPFALGTQTIGSILRPACFCGVVGYKPTYGTIPANGVSPLAPSVDHVGVLTANVEVAQQVASIFLLTEEPAANGAPRIGFCPTSFAERFDADVHVALEETALRLREGGADVERFDLPTTVAESVDRLLTIVAFEAHAALGSLRPLGFPPHLDALVASGAAIGRSLYRAALAWRTQTKPQIVELLAKYDALLLGAANAAPGFDSTGDPQPLGPWTFWGVPAVTIPMTRDAEGLPIGLQLVGAPSTDARLLAVAHWIEQRISVPQHRENQARTCG